MTLTPKTKTSSVILKILIQKLFTGNTLQKHPSLQSSLEIMRIAALVLNQDFHDFED